jgi:uncharacterized membrane protein
MLTVHGNLGEFLVVVYLAIAVLAAILANRGGLPAWVSGIAHGLLTIQVLLGVILLIRNPTAAPMPASNDTARMLNSPSPNWR